MGGFIALYVTACLNLGNPGSCVSEFVTELDAEPNDHDRVPWCRGPILGQRVRGEAPALQHLAVQRLELPDRQQAGPEKGAGMNLSVTRMDQHKGRSNRTQERTEAQRLSTSLGKVPKLEAVMTAQIINLADYRKAKEAEQVRKVVNDSLRCAQSNNGVVVIRDSGRLISGTAMVDFYGDATGNLQAFDSHAFRRLKPYQRVRT